MSLIRCKSCGYVCHVWSKKKEYICPNCGKVVKEDDSGRKKI